MATQRNRDFLEDKFQDGDRPTGQNFADLIKSFINIEDDKIFLDGNNNLNVPNGIRISTAANGDNGTIRFNDGTGTIEVFFGGIWNPIGGGGAFSEVNGGPAVAFNDGNVGIGTGATTPPSKLEIPLTANTGTPAQRVRLGQLSIHNGSANNAAFISHNNKATDADFALRQDSNGNTTINAGTNAQFFVSQGGTNRMILDTSGNFHISGTLNVIGNVTTNGNFVDNTPSDLAVKDDVKTLPWGLQDLVKLNPVSYRYNGVGGTPTDGKERIGLIAQEVQEIFPFLVKRTSTNDPNAESILSYESQPLLFIAINAIRELTAKVEKLESQLFGNSK